MSKNVSTFEVDMTFQILSKAKAKEYKSLSSKKERDEKGLFLVEGEKCVRDTLVAFLPEAIICTSGWKDSHPEFTEKWHDKIFLSDKKTLGIISSFSSVPEIIAVMKKPLPLKDIPKLKDNELYLLLDELQDPGNLGTIIRTCDWFGLYNIFASRNTVDVYSPKVVQSAMGSLSRVKVNYTDLAALIQDNRNLKVIGTLLDGEDINVADIKREGFLLMGNEGRGISPELKKFIDLPVTIPPVNKESHPDSLNVSIATAIVLSSICLK